MSLVFSRDQRKVFSGMVFERMENDSVREQRTINLIDETSLLNVSRTNTQRVNVHFFFQMAIANIFLQALVVMLAGTFCIATVSTVWVLYSIS